MKETNFLLVENSVNFIFQLLLETLVMFIMNIFYKVCPDMIQSFNINENSLPMAMVSLSLSNYSP